MVLRDSVFWTVAAATYLWLAMVGLIVTLHVGSNFLRQQVRKRRRSHSTESDSESGTEVVQNNSDGVIYWGFRSRPRRPVTSCAGCEVEYVHYNASTEPCDMLEGPCACGGWHPATEKYYCPRCRRFRAMDGM